jgi:hypothetical protein
LFSEKAFLQTPAVSVVQFTNIKGKTALLPSKLNAEAKNDFTIMFSDSQLSEASLYYR